MRSKTKRLSLVSLVVVLMMALCLCLTNSNVHAEEVDKPNATVSVLSPITLTPEEHSYMCWPSGDTTIERPLQIVMNFKANETLEQAKAGKFGKYLCDFYLTFNGLANGSIVADNCYLAGNYGSFGWIVIQVDGLEIEEGVSYPVVSTYDATLNYEDICGSVKNFTAAIHVDSAILEANPDFEVTLELKMKNPNDETDFFTVGEPATYNAVSLGLSTTVPEVEDNGIANVENEVVIESARQELINLGVSAEEVKDVVPVIDIEISDLPDESGKIVYNVSPMLKAGEKEVKIAEFESEITFRLPVLKTENKDTAKVYHNEDLLGVYIIKEENGNKYVEVSSKSFSTYTVEPVDTNPVAVVNNIAFTDLQFAINDAVNGDVIQLVDNIAITSSVVVQESQIITIDLCGKTISMEDASGKAASIINNKGTLTVDDTVGGGKIIINSTTPSTENHYAITTVNNAGTFVLEDGIIENSTEGGGANYGIDVTWYTKDVSITINGGSVISKRTAIRQNLYYDAKNTLTVNGGIITGNYGIQIFNATGEAHPSETKINGGEISGAYAIVTSFTSANASSEVDIEITDGTFDGYVYIFNGQKDSVNYPFNMRVTGGTFNGGYYTYLMGETNDDFIYLPTIFGGTFSEDVSYSVADGYVIEENADGTFGAVSIFGRYGIIRNIAVQNDAGEDRYQVVFLCGIDSLNYKKVGFEISVAGQNKKIDTNTVYDKYIAAGVTHTSSDFGSACIYIVGVAVNFPTDWASEEVTFRAYAIDLDGNEIYGEYKTFDGIYNQ